jgi:hypothetical protein
VSIIAKVGSGPSPIYELPLPLSPGKTVTAVRAGEVDPPAGVGKLTGGSIHPEATGILLRTNTDLLYYPMKPERTAAQTLATGACALLVADEGQGEAVTWLSSGAGYVTVGEGAGSPVSVAECDPP